MAFPPGSMATGSEAIRQVLNHLRETVGMPAVWVWSDAWIFEAVAVTSRSGLADLSEVIGAADVINHAIPSLDEIAGAVGRLGASGLVEVQDDRFGLSPAGRDLHGSCPSRNALDAVTWIHLVLTDRYRIGSEPIWTLDRQRYRGAVTRYRQRFEAAYKRLRRG